MFCLDTSAEVMFAALDEDICNTNFAGTNLGNNQSNKWSHFLEEKKEVEGTLLTFFLFRVIDNAIGDFG